LQHSTLEDAIGRYFAVKERQGRVGVATVRRRDPLSERSNARRTASCPRGSRLFFLPFLFVPFFLQVSYFVFIFYT